MASAPDDAAPAADPKAAEVDTAELARQWIAEIDAAERDQDRQTWLTRCKEILKIYKEDRARGTGAKRRKRYALFWSNIEVLKPAVLSRAPTAVVSRRFKDADPIGRVASEVLERGLNFGLDTDGFADTMTGCRDEYLLYARGQAWVRYIPTMRTADGQAKSDEIADSPAPYEVVDWEEVRPDRLHHEDFLHNVARSWKEVRWVSRRAFLTRGELKKRFPECGEHVPLDWAPAGKEDATDDQKKGAVYEIWDIETKRAIWVSKSYPNKVLDVRDDPLKLKDFFPCPRPLFGTLAPDSLAPIPDYVRYQDQAEEIDSLTTRIDKLIDSLRVRGFYSGANETDLNTLLKADDNTMIPVESWAALGDKGGVKGIIEWFPVDQIAAVLRHCFDARRQLIDDVYQVTGISDIQRGATDPDETLGAQQIKAGFGSMRTRERKNELARFARDILEIMGQVIASKFDAPTLAQMTGVQLLTAQEAQQLQAQIKLAQQAAMPPAPGMSPPLPVPQPDPAKVALLQQPTWDDVIALLRNPILRAFRIDIETDSTIEPNDQDEKVRRIEFVQAVGKYLAESLPVVQSAPQILPVIVQGLKFLVRGFRVGREMEDTIDRAMDELQQAAQAAAAAPPASEQPDPAEVAKAQAAGLQAQAAMGRVQVEGQRVQADHEVGMAQVQAENNRTAATAQTAMHETVLRASERRLLGEINSTQPMTAPTP